MRTDLQKYVAAMIAGNHSVCVQIEKLHDLYGYPPEMVTIGLKAIEEGQDAHRAIGEYLQGEE